MNNPRFQRLGDWLQWQETLHSKAIDLGLDRVREVARRLQLLNPTAKVITVAGTNGKGSCVTALEALLRGRGVSVGCFTSPHFHRYNERIRINGAEIHDALLCDAFHAIDEARDELSLTYFEFGLLAALLTFTQSELDFIILEVGLGGRLDAANIIDADIGIVTSIALDHEDWLGSDLEQIGREKAGIFRPQRWALCADAAAPASVRACAQGLGSQWLSAEEDFGFQYDADGRWTWRGKDADGERLSLSGLNDIGLPLTSLSAALQAMALLGFEPEDSDRAVVDKINLPGRSQVLFRSGVEYVLDVAHNPAAASYQAERLARRPPTGLTHCVCGVMADKDIRGIFAALEPVIDQWWCCGIPGNDRAASVDSLVELGAEQGLRTRACETVSAALSELENATASGDRVLVCGSFFTVAEAQLVLGSAEAGGDDDG